VNLLGETDARSLEYEHIEKLCAIAEEAARRYITSRVPSRGVTELTVSVESEENEVLNVEVDVELTLSPLFKTVDSQKLADEAVKAAFKAVEEYLRETGCRSVK